MNWRCAFVLLVLPCWADGRPGPTAADDLLIVDCLLPGQIRQLARNTTYLSARRPVKTTAFDCRIRNGEYVVEDRASLSTALKVWLATAEAGDVEAQTTVGEIFERGVGGVQDYAGAAAWYRRAADAGYARAQINLGNLYERGLGVPQDSHLAVAWYRRAAGIESEVLLDPTADLAPMLAAQSVERDALRQELTRLADEARTLRADLEAAQRVMIAATPAVAPDPIPEARPDEADALATVVALKQAIAVREEEMGALSMLLTQTRAELASLIEAAAQARAQAAYQAGEVAAATEATRIAQEESQRHSMELHAALDRLAERERALAAAAQQIDELRARTESNAAALAANVLPNADIQAGLLAGPQITLIDPVLPRTRGLVKIKVAPSLERRRIVGRVDAPAGLLSLSVNDSPAAPNSAGVFVAEIAMAQAEARVLLSAVDQQGKRADLDFVLMPAQDTNFAAVTSSGADQRAMSQIEFGNYHALLIGNQVYRHLPRLNTPGNDVEALSELLRTRFGFQTTVLRDATRYEILSALNELRAKLTSNDNLLLYYAGHGEIDEVNMRGFWLPADAEADSSANWISNVSVTDILNVINAKQVLLVADSCYSGTLTRSGIVGQPAASTPEERTTWLKLMASKRARVVLTSGGLAPVLDAGGGRHSVFAKAFIETLQATTEITEGQVLFRGLAARVAHAAAGFEFEQTPQFAPIAHAGHESGDFFLLPR